MNFVNCLNQHDSILMEGALVERLKREYKIHIDQNVALAKSIYDERAASALKTIWLEYIGIAYKYGLPFLAMTPTRRANRERIERAGVTSAILMDNVMFLRNIQRDCDGEMYVGGLLGCKGDAYTGEGALERNTAREFHKWQIELFAQTGVDYLYAGIMPTLPEATGMAQAMSDTGIPYIISFTIKRNGRLIDGTSISDAISHIDSMTDRKPICYMTNCVYPTIVYEALTMPFNNNDLVRSRFLGIQANTSSLDYAELECSSDLKNAEPEIFTEDMMRLRTISRMKIFGGCCGTDNRHIELIASRL